MASAEASFEAVNRRFPLTTFRAFLCDPTQPGRDER